MNLAIGIVPIPRFFLDDLSIPPMVVGRLAGKFRSLDSFDLPNAPSEEVVALYGSNLVAPL